MKNFAETNVPMTEAQISDELSADELELEDLERINGGLAPLAIAGIVIGGVAAATFVAGAVTGFMEGETEEADRCHGRS